MAEASLIIVAFDGVIGTVMQYPFFDPDACKKVYLRHASADGLRSLSERYQLVMITEQNEMTTKRIARYLERKGVHFDAVYKKHRDYSHKSYISYTQIY